MESPVFSATIPFRPIPIYGNRAQLVSGQVPPDDSPSFPAKSHEDQVMLAKQINFLSQISRFRPHGDYRFSHLAQFGTTSPAQMFNGINKFSVKNLAMISEIERSHAITQQKLQSLDQQKVYELSSVKTRCQGLLSPSVGASDSQRSPVDNSTVPVVIACANPYPNHYSYGRKVFPCPQCRYTTDRRNNLKRHMLTMHQTCSKTLECCGIMFATKASLREHAMIFHYHGYTCFYCGRRFCRKALLKRHLSVHNGQKDFVCPVCDYATSHKSNLERHRKVHCRPEENKACENESNMSVTSHDAPSTSFEIREADDNNNTNIVSSSDDESEEINVDSD